MKHNNNIKWLRNVVLGLDDGLVTTLISIMTVSSIAGTHLLATMIGVITAGAISMALGGYAAAKSVQDQNEWMIGLETGLAFLVGGIAPIIPILLNLPQVRCWSFACTALIALAFGYIKAHFSDKNNPQTALKSALFFLSIVITGTIIGIIIGTLIEP